MAAVRKRLAIAFARNFAAGLVDNAECAWQAGVGLTADELQVAQEEMTKIAARIQATVNSELLAVLGTDTEMAERVSAYETQLGRR